MEWTDTRGKRQEVARWRGRGVRGAAAGEEDETSYLLLYFNIHFLAVAVSFSTLRMAVQEHD
jgi:hypothetical protein